MTDPADHPTADLIDALIAALADGDHELADAILDGHGGEPADVPGEEVTEPPDDGSG
jgi:hypothetical protein